jgi:tetratricopeptide (TPR) repeat protein
MNRILAIILIFTSLISFSQPEETMKSIQPWQIKKYAKNADRVGDIYSAIDYYEYFLIKKPDDIKTSYKLGELYLKTRDYKTANKYFKFVYENDKKKYPLAHYYYALTLKYQGKYDEAKEHLESFLKDYKNGKESSKYRKIVKSDILGCEIANNLIDSALKVITNHLDTSVNKAHVEFSPIFIDNKTMWYASFKADKINYYKSEDSSKIPVRKFYEAKLINGKWKTTREIDEFNDPNFDVGNGAFSVDKNRFYFNKCRRNWKNDVICSIWMSEKKNDKWSTSLELSDKVNNKMFTSTQPTLGVDSKRGGDIIYFVSNRDGGKGGYDIWYTIYDTRKQYFKTPRNLGTKVNTKGEEFTPFYDNQTKTLFFSSNARPGLGGLDIFKTTGEQKKWFEPENVGYPINSSTDDIYFVSSKDRKKGYFVSNRTGGVALKNETCCDDIYEYAYTEFIDIKFEGHLIANKDNSVFAKINELMGIKNKEQRIDSIRVVLSVKSPNGKESIELSSYYTNEKGDCKFYLEPNKNYEIMVDNFGYFDKIIPLSTMGIKRSIVLRDTVMINPIPNEPIPVNIYYPFDEDYLTDEAKDTIAATLLIVLEEIPRVKVEISSHTDSKGEDDYNIDLSQRRAESVVKYLIKKGISKDRLVAKGYGETTPITPNKNEDGSDNEEGRAKNRRTEFKFIGNLQDFVD